MADLPEPVAALLRAANDRDTTAFLAGFTDDGVVDDWGREFHGAEAIRGWSDNEFIGVAVTLAVTEVTGRPARRSSPPRWVGRASTDRAISRSGSPGTGYPG